MSRTALRTIRIVLVVGKRGISILWVKRKYCRRSEGDSWWARMRTENGELMLAGILKHPRLRK